MPESGENRDRSRAGSIAAEARQTPDLVHEAPHTTPVRRLDEAAAARQPNLRWRPLAGEIAPCPD